MSNWDPDIISLLLRTQDRSYRPPQRLALGDWLKEGKALNANPNSTIDIPVEGQAKAWLTSVMQQVPPRLLSPATPDPQSPTILVRWGQETTSVSMLQALLCDFGPVVCTFGLVSTRYLKGRNCIIHHLASPRLQGLRELLIDSFPGGNDIPWIPHIVLACVEAGSSTDALKWVGGKRGSGTHRMSHLTGTKFEVSTARLKYWGTTEDIPIPFGERTSGRERRQITV